MCQRVTCPDCNKPDWAGCGAHVEAVLGNVKPDDRCRCREDGTRAQRKPTGLLSSLFGKR